MPPSNSDVLHVLRGPAQNGYTPRTERVGTREFLVAPVAMLLEGVHVGSGGRAYYPEEEISRFGGAVWNGVPVVVHHPMEGEEPISAHDTPSLMNEHVGTVQNTYWDGKLRAEVWVDLARLAGVRDGDQALQMLRNGRPLEVSTSHYHDIERTSGMWEGERYDFIVRNMRPDHLALLPGGVGACSLADGCGIGANQRRSDMGFIETVGQIMEQGGEQAWPGLVRKQLTLAILQEEASHGAIRSQLQQLVDAWDVAPNGPQGGALHYVREVFDDYFVYRREEVPSPVQGMNIVGGGSKMFRIGYSVDDGEVVVAEEDPVEVREKQTTEYIPVTQNQEVGPHLALLESARKAREVFEARA